MTATLALSLVVAVESAHAYSAFCPSIFTIRTFRDQQGTERAIRDGELMGSLFAIGLSGALALLTGSWLPIWFGIVTVIVMVSVYEWALRS